MTRAIQGAAPRKADALEEDQDCRRMRLRLEEAEARMRYRGQLTPAERAALGRKGVAEWERRQRARSAGGEA